MNTLIYKYIVNEHRDEANELDRDYGEDWITRIEDEDRKILDDKLNEVFENWINEFGYKPTWFKVVDVEKIKLNEVANEG
ncbi:hypothetical protein GSQ54_16200 [Clostridioides difficile]|nr:hypothetical protein [Clostridioides difficile]